MWPNPLETNWINWIKLFAVFPANFVTFTEEILNGKLNFCALLVDSFVIHMHLNSVPVQKKSCVSYGTCARYHCTLKMKHRRISVFFLWNAVKFFLWSNFFHKSWNLISSDNYETNYIFLNISSIFRSASKTRICEHASLLSKQNPCHTTIRSWSRNLIMVPNSYFRFLRNYKWL